ncbi:hypothetical protein H206_03651 [Candidatus Electrothrix aarhusensis]|uniref:Transposase/invertase (TIGR01784 family) n=1 Tax=Candidatus Electrothrix aarhusensis TaxID=1859131 RepID=A0A3S3SK61_9BACT|nr:hypothetical protein H206_03651 [Candidatus Electrothrix aarhusensis]
MSNKERYINLFTDYGFKKIFGEQPNKQLFEAAEIARFTPDQVLSYENSLKYYRDLKNSLDTAFDEGREEGRWEGREQRTLEIAKEMLAEGESAERIARFTGLEPAIVEELKRTWQKK